ncbi:tetratricopeptide repeat protein, partial [candidate division CSSED10-310 bacterium]
ADLAFHYEKADIDDKTIEYLTKAGAQAKKNYQNQQALDFYDRLLEKTADNLISIETLIEKSEVSTTMGKLNAGLEQISSAHILSGKIDDKVLMAKCLHQLGWIYFYQSEYKLAADCFNQQLALFQELDHKEGLMQAWHDLGVLHGQKGKIDYAQTCFETELELCEQYFAPNKKGPAIHGLAGVHFFKANYEISLDFLHEELEICNQTHDKVTAAGALDNMGILYKQMGNYEKAISLFNESLTLLRSIGKLPGLAYAHANLAGIFKEIGDYSTALSKYQVSLNLGEEIGDKFLKAVVESKMGDIHSILNEYRQAEECLLRAIEINENIGNEDGLCHNYYYLADLRFRQNRLNEAAEFCRKSSEISVKGREAYVKFLNKVLAAKIDFFLGDVQASERLIEMLEYSEDDDRTAALHYELYQMGRLKNIGLDIEEHRQKSLSIYQELSKEVPLIEYKQKIEELLDGQLGGHDKKSNHLL